MTTKTMLPVAHAMRGRHPWRAVFAGGNRFEASALGINCSKHFGPTEANVKPIHNATTMNEAGAAKLWGNLFTPVKF